VGTAWSKMPSGHRKYRSRAPVIVGSNPTRPTIEEPLSKRQIIHDKLSKRKLVVLTFVTLDGVMQAPGGPEEDTIGGFKHGGWSVGYWDDSLASEMNEQMSRPYDILLGRKTYEIFAAHWPAVKDPFAERINNARKYVASKTLKKADWTNSTLLKKDVVQEIKDLKDRDGPEIQVHGSGNLIQTLLKNDLVDEFRLKIYPVVLGKGKKLFAEGTFPAGFKLAYHKITPSGVVVANYERAGNVKTGSFASETQTERVGSGRTRTTEKNPVER